MFKCGRVVASPAQQIPPSMPTVLQSVVRNHAAAWLNRILIVTKRRQWEIWLLTITYVIDVARKGIGPKYMCVLQVVIADHLNKFSSCNLPCSLTCDVDLRG